MSYKINFGENTDVEYYETIEEVEEIVNEYVLNHLQYGEDFEEEKQKFMKNNVRVQ
jgi:hypothetical protein